MTPTKPEKKEETENPNKIQKELLGNNEDGKDEPKTTETKKGNSKPNLTQSKFGTPTRTGSLSKQESLMNFLSPNSKVKSMFAQSLEQHILPHDLESFGAMNDLDERDGKRKSPPRGSSPNEMMHDKKIKPLSAIPFPVFTNGTRPKSVSK